MLLQHIGIAHLHVNLSSDHLQIGDKALTLSFSVVWGLQTSFLFPNIFKIYKFEFSRDKTRPCRRKIIGDFLCNLKMQWGRSQNFGSMREKPLEPKSTISKS